ncbi:MAG: heme-binding protein [Thaumarchaeota archaeon]|nr:MAG: heme-binding protein [Nitrososphaerota archaeon]
MNCNLFRDSVEISDAKKVVSAALEKGRQMNFQIAAAVVDVRGSVLVAEKMEGASALTTQLAEGKAAAAALLGRSIRDLYQSIQENPAFWVGVSGLTGWRLLFGKGGVVIRKDGKVVGAVGVSGARADEDDVVAESAANSIQ